VPAAAGPGVAAALTPLTRNRAAIMAMEDELKELLIERLFLDLDAAELDAGTPLAEYGIDSFQTLELIVAIEESFGVKFGQADITADTLRSIRSLCACVEAKQAAG
jgi:acyl carrier protein